MANKEKLATLPNLLRRGAVGAHYVRQAADEIELLQRQLQQAQEERDAAIERAEAAEATLFADAEADVALTTRVLQAERELAEQRALAEARRERGETTKVVE